MCGIIIAVVVLAAIVASLLHISAGWALGLVVGGIVVAGIVQARNPNATVRTSKTGMVFSNICPACRKHNKSGASVCRHCGTALKFKPAPAPVVAAAPDTKTCPDCAETVLAAARKCRFCGYEFN
jgi:predicted RNA-binding Zn-ribbon protein involved in translation (DUF1610 family)